MTSVVHPDASGAEHPQKDALLAHWHDGRLRLQTRRWAAVTGSTASTSVLAVVAGGGERQPLCAA
jgi:hypothetical protein